MLVLSRKIGESICIGNGITITFLKFKSGQLKIGVNAPKDLPVHREEIHKNVKDRLYKNEFLLSEDDIDNTNTSTKTKTKCNGQCDQCDKQPVLVNNIYGDLYFK